MQSVQTKIRCTAPLTRALTVCRFGRQLLLLLLLAWLTVFPTERFLPQIEQILAMIMTSSPFR